MKKIEIQEDQNELDILFDFDEIDECDQMFDFDEIDECDEEEKEYKEERRKKILEEIKKLCQSSSI